MKYIGMIKYFIIVLTLGAIAAFMIFGCSSETGRNVTGTTRIDRDRDTSRRDSNTSSTLDCKLPSGSGCKGDQDCEDMCKDDDYLDLTGKAKDKCFDLSKSTVEKLDSMFEVLKEPRDDDLSDLTEEDVNLLCGAIEELDEDFWLRALKNYKSGEARDILQWVIDTEQVTTLLDQLSNDEARDHLEHLLVAFNGTKGNVTATNLYNALISSAKEIDDNQGILEYAADNSNDLFIEMVHDLVIDGDEGKICTGASNLPTYSGSGTLGDSSYPEFACMLAVYCQATDEESLRSDIAETINNRGIESLITDAETGALDLPEDDGEEWSDAACTKLQDSDWDDGIAKDWL